MITITSMCVLRKIPFLPGGAGVPAGSEDDRSEQEEAPGTREPSPPPTPPHPIWLTGGEVDPEPEERIFLKSLREGGGRDRPETPPICALGCPVGGARSLGCTQDCETPPHCPDSQRY